MFSYKKQKTLPKNDILKLYSDKFTAVAPEVFINICNYLHPTDLLSVARVCRRFYDYLRCEISSSTELIWRQSRINFLPWYQVPPPAVISEQFYVRLLVQKACQMCGNKKKGEIVIN